MVLPQPSRATWWLGVSRLIAPAPDPPPALPVHVTGQLLRGPLFADEHTVPAQPRRLVRLERPPRSGGPRREAQATRLADPRSVCNQGLVRATNTRRTLIWAGIALMAISGLGAVGDRNWALVGLAAVGVIIGAVLLRLPAKRAGGDGES
jgi:hypothetical protein